jgi:lipopolysaccharide export system protein LptA
MKIIKKRIWLLFIVCIGQLQATEKITIEADYLQIDSKNNFSHYRGNVILKKGNLTIKGNNLKLWQNKNKKIKKITINGTPASFKNIDNNAPITASANSIIFEPLSFLLYLNKNAKLSTAKEQFMSNKITYNTKTQNFTAGDKNKKNGKKDQKRVKIILQQ